jgi:hypothetical protein
MQRESFLYCSQLFHVDATSSALLRLVERRCWEKEVDKLGLNYAAEYAMALTMKKKSI